MGIILNLEQSPQLPKITLFCHYVDFPPATKARDKEE